MLQYSGHPVLQQQQPLQMTSPVAVPSPLAHGSRQLHQTLDYLATISPDRLYAAIPRSSDLSGGFRDISFCDMRRCSDVAAHWIYDNFGRSQTFQTLCFIGIPDLRSAIIFFGAVKCGFKVDAVLSSYGINAHTLIGPLPVPSKPAYDERSSVRTDAMHRYYLCHRSCSHRETARGDYDQPAMLSFAVLPGDIRSGSQTLLI